VILFVVGSGVPDGLSVEHAQRVLEEVAAPVPGIGGRPSQGWQSADGSAVAACLAHDPERLGGVRYHHFADDELALFAGRPMVWTSETEADGRGPLDPRYYLAPAEEWRPRLDARYAVARWERGGGRLEVFTDPLGAYPVYWGSGPDGTWVSNSPAVVARLLGDEEWSPKVLAMFLTIGWDMDGDPLWRSATLAPRGSRLTLRGGRVEEERDLLRDADLRGLFEVPWSTERTTEIIVAATRALADWPDRELRLGLSGGFDSRLALAGVLLAGVPVSVTTKVWPGQPGYPETEELAVAARVCRAAGIPQTVVDVGRAGHPLDDVRRTIAILRATGPGTVSVGDSVELAVRVEERPPMLISGAGAEIARYIWQNGKEETPDEFATRMYPSLAPRPPGRLVTAEPQRMVADWLRAWAERHAPLVPPVELPKLYHLLVRIGTWSPSGPLSRDFGFDTLQPVAIARLLPQQCGLPLEERKHEHWHRAQVAAMRPDLASVPYEALGESLRLRVRRELRRRAELEGRRLLGSRSDQRPADPFFGAWELTRDAVAARHDHPAWQFLDRRRVKRLFSGVPERLDPRSRSQVLRLATVFIDP
jgi:hypothetical protein